MRYLPENEKYNINTLDELLNCPLNMIDQAMKSVLDIWEYRSENKVSVQDGYINLINDGKKDRTLNIGADHR